MNIKCILELLCMLYCIYRRISELFEMECSVVWICMCMVQLLVVIAWTGTAKMCMYVILGMLNKEGKFHQNFSRSRD